MLGAGPIGEARDRHPNLQLLHQIATTTGGRILDPQGMAANPFFRDRVRTNSGTIVSAGGTFRFAGATVEATEGVIIADTGVVAIAGSTVENGTLRVTDAASSQVRFSGDVTLNDVPWVDDGAGEFTVYNASARVLGDYAAGLPAGYTLAVWTERSGAETRLTFGGGDFPNEGMLEIRHSGGNYGNHPDRGDGAGRHRATSD